MKAIALLPGQERPCFQENMPEPTPAHSGELILNVKAAAIKHLDIGLVSGKHYAGKEHAGSTLIPGVDGVGLLADGRRVYALGMSGMLAEKALVDPARMVAVPHGLDNATAAALPNAVAGSAMALRFRAGIQPGETVLINGATGFTGKVAVQIARHYGAGCIVATGRNPETLAQLNALGADEALSLEDPVAFEATLKQLHQGTPVDIVLDYLWGAPTAGILRALQGHDHFTHRTRLVSVGTMAGDLMPLSGALLRSTDLTISGSGLGSWSRKEVGLFLSEILPRMFDLAAERRLLVDIRSLTLEDIAAQWGQPLESGVRLVAML